jgi:perosamine synthetase
LDEKNIQTRIFYPPIHQLLPYKKSGNKFKVTTEISERGLWLPSSVTLKDNEIDYICNRIREFFKK